MDTAKNVKPSGRGELEITSVNEDYLHQGDLKLQSLSRVFAWIETGTHEALTEATEIVKAVEKRIGLKIACLEKIGLRMRWLTDAAIYRELEEKKGDYYEYLKIVS